MAEENKMDDMDAMFVDWNISQVMLHTETLVKMKCNGEEVTDEKLRFAQEKILHHKDLLVQLIKSLKDGNNG